MTFKYPRYRVLAQRYNFDEYSSKGSTVHPAKKYHYNAGAIEAISDVATVPVSAEPNQGKMSPLTVPNYVQVNCRNVGE